jgi:hypothetical protein
MRTSLNKERLVLCLNTAGLGQGHWGVFAVKPYEKLVRKTDITVANPLLLVGQ